MEKTPLHFITHYVKIFKWTILLLSACCIIGQMLTTLEPYFLAKIYTLVTQTPLDWHKIILFATIAAVIAILAMLISESAMFLRAKYLPKLHTMVMRDTFEDVNRQSISFFSREMTGNISGKVQLLSNNTVECLDILHEFFYIFSSIAVSLIVLGIVHWFYAVVLIIWIVLVTLISSKLGKIRHKYSKESGKQSSKANGVVVDALSNYSEIKSFANFKFEKYNLLQALAILRHAETKEKTMMAFIRIIQQIITISSFIGFVFFSLYLLNIQQINAEQFIFASTLFMRICGMAFQISWMYNSMARFSGNISSALDTLAVEPEIKDKKNAIELPIRKSKIVFENVVFGYHRDNPLFNGINVTIGAGEKVGLVGLSGSGKSTFVKLISRYYDILGGAIKINGHNIKDVTQNSLHRAIASMPQDICLFNRTLKDNIRYGKTNATEKEIIAAAQKAYADNFIKEFPDGYETKVGDRGVILSGGERQRIAIARAILKNAPILIFDEATSALDSQSEQHIQQSLSNLMKGKTVLAIAHRLSTLKEMDRILVFDKGKIIESGSHQKLLELKGQYYKLFTMQVDGFMGS